MIVSDQGKEFCNKLMNSMEKLLGFKHKVSAAYHPQTNGQTERAIETIKNRIQKTSEDSKDCVSISGHLVVLVPCSNLEIFCSSPFGLELSVIC